MLRILGLFKVNLTSIRVVWRMPIPGIELREGVTGGCVTLASGFLNNVSLLKFRKLANIEWLFRQFPSFYAYLCNKISILHKIGLIFPKHRNFLKFFDACGAKNMLL